MTDSYTVLKAIHIFGVVIFLGNIIITGWWKAAADRTGEPAVIAFAQRQVVVTDWLFTLGGVVVLFAAGMTNALIHGLDIMRTPWIAWSLGLFTLSGVIWVAILIPVQAAQSRIARGFAAGGAIPERYWQLNRIWYVAGIAATVIPLGAVWLMVAKPT